MRTANTSVAASGILREAERHVDALTGEQDLPAPDVGEDADQLDEHGGEEPGQEDAPVEPAHLGPEVRQVRGYQLEAWRRK
jgi:hypothetical protein